MYINKFVCPYEVKRDDNKCGRIFRPWDSGSAEKIIRDSSQDCTVSTTTEEDEDIICISKERGVKIEVIYNSNDKEYIKDNRSTSSFALMPKTLCSEKNTTSYNRTSLGSNTSCKADLDKLPDKYISPQPSQESISYKKYDQKHLATSDTLLHTSPLPLDIIHDPYNSLYPDLMQTNLAQHLGLPPNDPLVLESLAQGYAMEEYVRVLNQEQQAKLLAAKKQRPKKYKCPHCNVGFSNNGQLKGHIRIHTGERPFKCDDKDCGKTFTRNEELTRHKRIHSGLRPFPCTHCGKRFGRKDHLKKHSRTHFQPRGLYAVPVVLPFEAWATGQTNGYPFFPMIY